MNQDERAAAKLRTRSRHISGPMHTGNDQRDDDEQREYNEERVVERDADGVKVEVRPPPVASER